MSVAFAVKLFREALWTILIVASPVLGTSLIIGLIVSIFQATTSIQEQTLTFVPKLIGIFLSLILFISLIFQIMINFSRNLFISLPDLVKSEGDTSGLNVVCRIAGNLVTEHNVRFIPKRTIRPMKRGER